MCVSCLQAPANGKLPALFLLDSIAKNAKEPFIQIFSRNLPEVGAMYLGEPATGAVLPHGRSNCCPCIVVVSRYPCQVRCFCMQLLRVCTRFSHICLACCHCWLHRAIVEYGTCAGVPRGVGDLLV